MNVVPATGKLTVPSGGVGDGFYRELVGVLAAPVYACDAEGRVTFFNEAAAALWGRRPELGADRWCGAWRQYRVDGSPLPPEASPMAEAVREGRGVRGVEVIIERPDGTRRRVLPHPDPVRDASGKVVGGVSLLVDMTERREAERAEALLAAIVESSDDAIVSKTLEGVVTSWNSGARRIFGYTAEEILGRPITTLIPPERHAEEDRILAKLQRGERVEHFETVRVTKDGRLIDVSLTVSPVRDREGRLIGASKVARDITEQLRAREALRRSERNLADFFENATLGLHWVDAEGVITRANKAELAMLGYEAHEYVGRPIADFHVDRAVSDDMLARLGRGETLLDYPARMRRKDGAIRHVRVSSNGLWEGGRFVHTRCFTRDVTEQVLAQEALAQSEAKLRAILSLLPVGVYSCDAEGRITFFNRRAAELWGHEPDLERTRFCACPRVFRPDGTVIDPGEIPMVVAVREGRSFRDTEAVFERRDGTRFHVSVNIDPVFDEEGRVRGAINVFADVSVQVAARRTLEQQQRALEEAVAKRTAELDETHRRLRQSERMAALGTLSAGIGHDMGNLLLPVRVSLEALASAEFPQELRAEVDRIRTSVRYLQQLASGLRMMSLDPERRGPEEPVQIRAWWADAYPIVKNALPRGVSLEAEVSEEAWVKISRPALTQAVFNLAQNAGEALRGRPDARVRITAERAGEHVVLAVEDNGPGMTREVLNRCMEPFFTTKVRGISTGLGLVLVSGIVREAGGTVQIRTEPEQGATFRMVLPAVEPPSSESEAASSRRGRAVVDVRDPRMRSMVAAELRHLCFDVVAATEGEGVDVVVADGGSALSPGWLGARHVVVLADGGGPGVRAVGARPRLEAMRNALRAAALSADGKEAAAG